MPRIPGRATMAAAMAAPLVLFLAPVTASADVPDGAFTAGVATPAGAAVTFVPFDHDDYSEVFTAPPVDDEADEIEVDELEIDTVDVDVDEDSSQNVIYAENVIAENITVDQDGHEDGSEDVLVDDEETVELAPAAVPASVTDDDDDVHHHVYSDVTWDDEETGAYYEDTTASAGIGGAWVTTVESGAVTSHNEHMLSDGDTAAWYHEATAAAGSDGAFVESTSSAAVSDSDDDWSHDDWSHDDDSTFAEYEHVGAYAGPGGAWVGELESAAGEIDD
jgi:hypothetical protein